MSQSLGGNIFEKKINQTMCMTGRKGFYGCSLQCSEHGMDKKDKIPGNQLFNHANKQSKKVVVSAWVPWKGATKPFFVNESSLKVNEKTYKKHLEKQLFPEVDMNVTSWIFPQER